MVDFAGAFIGAGQERTQRMNARTAQGQLELAQNQAEFEKKKFRVEQFKKNVDAVESTLENVQNQFAIRMRDAEGRVDPNEIANAKRVIEQEYRQVVTPLIQGISRSGQMAQALGIPIDLPTEMSRLVRFRNIPSIGAEQRVEATGKGLIAGAQAQAKVGPAIQQKRQTEQIEREIPKTVDLLMPDRQTIRGFNVNDPAQRRAFNDALDQGASLAPSRQEIRTGALAKKTRNTVEEKLFNTQEGLIRARKVREKLDRDFLELGPRLQNAGNAFLEKVFGKELEGASADELARFSDFIATALNDINLYIKEITGAQMSVFEADRLRKGFPDPGEGLFPKQSFTEFTSRLDSRIQDLEASQIRYKLLIDQGFATGDLAVDRENDVGERASRIMSLEQARRIFNERANQIFQQLTESGVSENEAKREAAKRAREEFRL